MEYQVFITKANLNKIIYDHQIICSVLNIFFKLIATIFYIIPKIKKCLQNAKISRLGIVPAYLCILTHAVVSDDFDQKKFQIKRTGVPIFTKLKSSSICSL